MTTATSAKRNSMLLMALCAIMWSLGGYQTDFLESTADLRSPQRYRCIDPGRIYVRHPDAGEFQQVFFWCRDRAFHILHILRLRQQADDCGQRYSTPVYCTDFYSSDVGIFIQAEIT